MTTRSHFLRVAEVLREILLAILCDILPAFIKFIHFRVLAAVLRF